MAGSAVVGILRVLLTADTATFDTAMKRGAESAKVFSRDMNKLGAQATQLGSALTKTLTVPLLGLGVFAAKSAIDFQSAFAGVRKTVDATEAEFAQMSQAFRDLAKTIPISVNELARLGEAAGALGIPKAEIVDFARVMALLGVTTNVTADQAAESIAKIQNIFGAAGKETDRFAATLVDLGNKGASTEAEILSMATRVASAGNSIGLSQGQVLGFSAAIANVGMEAEAGGSAMSRVMNEIALSVSRGGASLAEFAKTASMSVDDFSALFKRDATEAILRFIEGLGKVKKSGGDLIGTLDQLGFTEIRQSDLLRRLAGDSDKVRVSLEQQAKAWKDNTALTEEARKRFETVQSKLTLLWNRLKDVGITFGNALLPMITATIGLFDRLIPLLERAGKAFADLPMPAQATAVGLAGIAAAAGPALFVVGQLAFAAGALAKVFTTGGLLNGLSKFFGVAGGGSSIMTGLGAALQFFKGPVGWIIGIGSALLTVTGTWDEFFRILRAGIQIVRNVAAALLDEFIVPLGKAIFGIGKDVLNWLDRFLGGLMPISDRLKVLGATFTWLMGKAADFAENLAGIPRRITVFVDTEFAAPARLISPGGAERGERPGTSNLTQAAAGSASFAQQLAGARKEIASLSAAVRSDLVAAIQSGAFSMEDLKKKTTLSELALKLFEDQVKGTGTATKKTAEEGIKLLADSMADAWKQRAQTLDFLGLREIAELERIYNLEQQGLENNLQIQADLIQQSWNDRARMLDFNGLRAMAEIEAQYKDELVRANHFTTTIGDAFAKIPSILVSAFTGGGGIKGAAKALGATFGADLMSGIFGSAGSKGADGIFKAGTGLLKNFSGMIGKFLGQALPVIGSLVGPLIGLIGKLFGKSEESAKVSPLRDEFFKMHGGLEKLNPQVLALTGNLKLVEAVFKAKTVDEYNAAIQALTDVLNGARQAVLQAGDALVSVQDKLSSVTSLTPELQAALDAAFNSKTPQDYLKALKEINRVIDEQATKQQTILSTLDKYGLKWTAAGRAVKQAKLNEVAKGLITDFDILVEAGVDINHQMKAMGPSLRTFIKDAQEAGVEVPEAMRRIIQTGIDAGEVFDKDGKKITDITQLGLTFGVTMETAMQTVGLAVDRLTIVLEALAKFFGIDLPAAAETGAQKTQDALDGIKAPVLNVGVKWDGKISSLTGVLSGYLRDSFRVPQLPDSARSGAASGALVQPWGLQHLAFGGVAGALARFQHGGFAGTDTVPAMLTPGELVLNAAQQRNLAAALNSGGRAPVTINVYTTIDGVFSENDLDQTMTRFFVPKITRIIEDNVNGARTNLQDVLGVP